jgi:hypothetical protein
MAQTKERVTAKIGWKGGYVPKTPLVGDPPQGDPLFAQYPQVAPSTRPQAQEQSTQPSAPETQQKVR